jgi:organic hydroperoxide reductase OsmC/OhrA
MTPRTFTFVTSLRAAGPTGTVQAPPRAPLAVDTPPDFGGAPDRWSPEHLLAAAVSACFWTTARALAPRRGLTLLGFASEATATVEKRPHGLELTGVRLAVELEVPPAELERAHRLVAETEQRCLVSQALRVPVRVEAVITARQEPAVDEAASA